MKLHDISRWLIFLGHSTVESSNLIGCSERKESPASVGFSDMEKIVEMDVGLEHDQVADDLFLSAGRESRAQLEELRDVMH